MAHTELDLRERRAIEEHSERKGACESDRQAPLDGISRDQALPDRER